ncbi:hypothetical protein QVA70_13960, partial [Staphylococcus aureus]|nr:hypothetical protein [Staphylococcus aureus]
MYGSWEATIYNNNYKASDKAKDKLRKNAIKQFDPKTGSLTQCMVVGKLQFTTITIKQVTKQKINYVKMLLSNS